MSTSCLDQMSLAADESVIASARTPVVKHSVPWANRVTPLSNTTPRAVVRPPVTSYLCLAEFFFLPNFSIVVLKLSCSGLLLTNILQASATLSRGDVSSASPDQQQENIKAATKRFITKYFPSASQAGGFIPPENDASQAFPPQTPHRPGADQNFSS